jgi:hypothetical protein
VLPESNFKEQPRASPAYINVERQSQACDADVNIEKQPRTRLPAAPLPPNPPPNPPQLQVEVRHAELRKQGVNEGRALSMAGMEAQYGIKEVRAVLKPGTGRRRDDGVNEERGRGVVMAGWRGENGLGEKREWVKGGGRMENGVDEGRVLGVAGGKMENEVPQRRLSTDFDHNADFIPFEEDYEDELKGYWGRSGSESGD